MNKRGIAPLVLIIIGVVVVAALVGGIWYFAIDKEDGGDVGRVDNGNGEEYAPDYGSEESADVKLLCSGSRLCSNNEYTTTVYWDREDRCNRVKLDDESKRKLESAIRERGYAGFDEISDLTCLERLWFSNLNQLKLGDKGSLDGLSSLVNLKELGLLQGSIKDVSALSSLTNLKSLDLTKNIDVSDYSPISSLTSLKKFRSGTSFIDDISFLSGLTNLEDLDLYDNKIVDVSPLSGLTNLKELDLGANDELTDVSSLSSLKNLEELSLNPGNVPSDNCKVLQAELPNTNIIHKDC